MRRLALLLTAFALSACAVQVPDVPQRRIPADIALPPMKSFAPARARAPTRSNASIAADFMDLAFRLESGRELDVFTRFEGPITVRVTGPEPVTLAQDLDRLIDRLRSEAGIPIRRVEARADASITIEILTRGDVRRAVPQAACFVVPRVSSWDEFRRARGSSTLDWTTLRVRERMSIFIPGDVSPQEVRDCLHEEMAQAIGPLNDLYRLTDSVFNDDNFHTVLTGFDMLILRAYYDPSLQSGMSRDLVANRLPAILARINPRGEGIGHVRREATTRDWIDAIETALGPRTSPNRRRSAAARAVEIARAQGWNDNRLAFALYALGRLSLGTDTDLALASFLQAGKIYSQSRDTRIQEAHIGMQLAAFALSAGQPDLAIDLVNRHEPPVREAQNAALLASLLLVRAEALAMLGRDEEARSVRLDSLGWARYGFGSERNVMLRASEISSLAPETARGDPT